MTSSVVVGNAAHIGGNAAHFDLQEFADIRIILSLFLVSVLVIVLVLVFVLDPVLSPDF